MRHQHEHGSNLPTVFSYDETNKLRTIIIDEKPWFAATDVCSILGIKLTHRAVSSLDDDDRQSLTGVDSLGKKNQMTFINESGMYHLVFRSYKPAARRFKKWVTSKVLPTIRKAGSFSIYNKIDDIRSISFQGTPMFHYVDLLSKAGMSLRSGSISRRRRIHPAEFVFYKQQWWISNTYGSYIIQYSATRKMQEMMRERKQQLSQGFTLNQLQLFGEGGLS